MPISASARRSIFQVPLRPVAGTRFQPAGFPDLGAALFKRPSVINGTVTWEDALLVESAQSMANHLEATAWDRARNEPVSAVSGLPWIRVIHADDGEFLTSSRLEAHRLASAFVKDSTLDGKDMRGEIRARLNLRDDRPMSPQEIARQVFALDPFCLIHGVFFAESAKVWPGQPRIARALTGCVEAYGVERAESGGVKRDMVRHSLGEGTSGGTAEGYGTVPYHRTEWTATAITAWFSMDRQQYEAYGLGEAAAELLEAISLWEIRSLLDLGLRLRTACDLAPVSADVLDDVGTALPSLVALERRINALVPRCSDLTGGGGPIDVRWSPPKAKSS